MYSPKNMHVRSIEDSELSVGVNVSANGCLPICSLPSPYDNWDRLQLTPVTLRLGFSRSRKCIYVCNCVILFRKLKWLIL